MTDPDWHHAIVVEDGVDVAGLDRPLVDARLLGPGVTDNPYWDAVRALPAEDITWRYERRWVPRAFPWPEGLPWRQGKPPDTGPSRFELTHRYAWAVPDPATLAFVAAHCGPRVVEVGAGTGYWAWQLAQLGADVAAYDTHPPDRGGSYFHSPWDPEHGPTMAARPLFHPVRRGGPARALAHPDRTLLLCWPPPADPMARRTLACYQGDRLVLIADEPCCGDERFYAQLDRWWEQVDEHRPVQWFGIKDRVTVYDRARRATPTILEDRW